MGYRRVWIGSIRVYGYLSFLLHRLCPKKRSSTHISHTHIKIARAGFPYLGKDRALKRLLEGCWEGRLSEEDVRRGYVCVCLCVYIKWGSQRGRERERKER